MKLSTLLQHIATLAIHGDDQKTIQGIEIDSRHVQPNTLFIALKGTQTDGHQYIPQAIAQGATAIVYSDNLPTDIPVDITTIRVADTEAVTGPLATQYYGNPSEHLCLVGVTGTNGKTTIATVLYELYKQMGYNCGLCSTVANYIGDEVLPTEHTTPDAITLNRLLARMLAAGCQYVFMECSSHAIHQQRIGGLHFAGGIFTNLTRDHLDYHKTFEHYRDAKKAFFDSLAPQAFAIINVDDKNGRFMVQNTAAHVITYATRVPADHQGRIIEESIEGMLLALDGQEVSTRFVGRFNVSNLLAIYATSLALGQSADQVLCALSQLHPVNGRFETLHAPTGFSVVIDYAHTPDALDNVLEAINEIVRHRAQVITVCGAGGNRDKGKRPLMACAAVKQSDKVIITSDNPRNEVPEAIIADMLAGLDKEQLRQVISITDRREAIKAACMLAQPGDVVLIAGKGHESYQEIRGVKHHFDDHEEVHRVFELLA